MAALSFANEDEASSFHDTFQRRESHVSRASATERPSMVLPPQVVVPQNETRPSIVKSPSTSAVKSADKKEKESGGGFMGTFGKKKGTKTKGGIDKSMISDPSNFQ